MQKIPLIAAIVVSAAIGGCTKDEHCATDTAKVAETIKAEDAQWAKDYAARDVKAINAHYADDGALAGPGYLATNDLERRAVLTAFMKDPGFMQKFASDRVDVAPCGNFAASRGHFSVTLTDPTNNNLIDYAGSYLTVYRMEADGKWKAIDRFLTTGPEPLSATTGKAD